MKDRELLNALLDRRNEHPEQIAEIDGEIWGRFGREVAVWVLDMSGFSRLTMQYGITHYLAMIRRMQRTVLPLVARHGGRPVKTEADNLFVVFDTVDAAVTAAVDTQARLREANALLPADWDLHVGIGIDFGRVLVIDGEDIFGHAMNIASKLGEDLAGPDEILISDSACEQLDDEHTHDVEPFMCTISGITVNCVRVKSR